MFGRTGGDPRRGDIRREIPWKLAPGGWAPANPNPPSWNPAGGSCFTAHLFILQIKQISSHSAGLELEAALWGGWGVLAMLSMSRLLFQPGWWGLLQLQRGREGSERQDFPHGEVGTPPAGCVSLWGGTEEGSELGGHCPPCCRASSALLVPQAGLGSPHSVPMPWTGTPLARPGRSGGAEVWINTGISGWSTVGTLWEWQSGRRCSSAGFAARAGSTKGVSSPRSSSSSTSLAEGLGVMLLRQGWVK